MSTTTQTVKKDARVGRLLKEQAQNPGIERTTRAYQAIVSTIAGDGDYTDIQSAINYVHTNTGYGVVFIKNGTYTLTDDITLYSNITVLGESQTGTILKFTDTTKFIKAIGTSGNEIENLHLRNFTVRDNTSVGANNGAIHYEFCWDSTISYIKMISTATTSGGDIQVENCRRVVVERNYLTTSSGTIRAYDGIYNITIDRNRIEDPTAAISGPVLSAAGGLGNFITNNYITGVPSGGTAIGVSSWGATGLPGFIIKENVIHTPKNGAGYAIDVNTSIERQGIIANNYIQGYYSGTNKTFTSGIRVGQADHVAVTGNKIIGIGTYGIEVTNGDYNTIVGNNIDDCGTDAIIIGVGANKCVVDGNYAEDGITDNGTNTVLGDNATGV